MEEKLICANCTHQLVCVHKDMYGSIFSVCYENVRSVPGPFKLRLHCKFYKEAKPKMSIKLEI